MKPSQKPQCKAVVSMILLKFLHTNIVLEEQAGHSDPTSLIRALSFPMSKMTNRNMLHRNKAIFHCLMKVLLFTSVKCVYKPFL